MKFPKCAIYTYLIFKLRKEILIHVITWMKLEGMKLCEISQSQKDKSYIFPLI